MASGPGAGASQGVTVPPERRRTAAAALVATGLFLLLPLVPLVGADGVLTADIVADWTDHDGDGQPEHVWEVVFDAALSAQEVDDLLFSVQMLDLDGLSPSGWNLTAGNGLTSADKTTWTAVIPVMPEFGDVIDLEVSINGTVLEHRIVDVTAWNQPVADHEITIDTTWSLAQGYVDGNGTQSYDLDFTGRGWQRRVGSALEANELGHGTLVLVEYSEAGRIELDLDLTRVWRNLSATGSVVMSEVFEMVGDGDMVLITDDGAGRALTAAIEVVGASLNRSTIDGIVSEGFKLEGTGELWSDQIDGPDSWTNLSGDVSLLRVATWDVDGVRLLDFSELQATADMVVVNEDEEFDLDVNEMIVLELWEEGVRTEQRSLLDASGTLGVRGEDDNGSFQVNATVHSLRTDIRDGHQVTDDFHVDGIYSGSIAGTFGILRTVEWSGQSGNISGDLFPTNLIHQDSWLNVTLGGPFGVGATHNETDEWIASPVDWENRTMRLKWTQTGADPSTGDEWYERSPIEQDPVPPLIDSPLGSIDLTREAGLVPAQLRPSDRVLLADAEGVAIEITALASSTVVRDGHALGVTTWSGEYAGGLGEASGSVIADGVLAGLLGDVKRSLPINTLGGSVTLGEQQTLARVLSPAIVTAEENTAPRITDVRLREARLINEDGGLVHLEVLVVDPEWNVVEVMADLSALGLGNVSLSDDGLLGDHTVGDDVWTMAFTYPGIMNGSVNVTVSARDWFGETDVSAPGAWVLRVVDRPPRLLDASTNRSSVARGGSVMVQIEAEDAAGVARVEVDWTDHGGWFEDLVEDEGLWTGVVTVPGTTTPGALPLVVRLTDAHGAVAVVTTGVMLGITNDGPRLEIMEPTSITRPAIGETTNVTLVVNVTDNDSITSVQGKLGELAPIGQSDEWIPFSQSEDALWWVTVQARSGLPAIVSVELRAFDVHGAQGTMETMIDVDDAPVDIGGGDPAGFARLVSEPVVLMSIIGVVVVGTAGGLIFVVMRGGGLADRFGDE